MALSTGPSPIRLSTPQRTLFENYSQSRPRVSRRLDAPSVAGPRTRERGRGAPCIDGEAPPYPSGSRSDRDLSRTGGLSIFLARGLAKACPETDVTS